jgi:hypothetical protein
MYRGHILIHNGIHNNALPHHRISIRPFRIMPPIQQLNHTHGQAMHQKIQAILEVWVLEADVADQALLADGGVDGLSVWRDEAGGGQPFDGFEVGESG